MLSVSKINTFINCPKKFYYVYVEGRKEKPNIHSYKGSIIHEIIEDYFNRTKYVNPKDFVEKGLKDRWSINELNLSKEEEETERNETREILKFFADRIEQKIKLTMLESKIKDVNHAFNYIKPKHNEIKITIEEEGINGRIDAIEEDFDGRASIVDYKTSKKYKDNIKEDYERQARMYVLLYYLKYKKLPDSVKFNYLRYGETYIFPATLDQIKLARMDINFVRENTKSLNETDYPKKTSKLCDYCDFKNECFKLEKQVTL